MSNDPTPTARDYGEAVTKMAAGRAIGLTDLSRRAKLGSARLARRLDGLVDFTPAELERVAAALEVTPAEIDAMATIAQWRREQVDAELDRQLDEMPDLRQTEEEQ